MRERLGLTLLDGYAELALAVAAGVRPRTLFYCPALAAGEEQLALVGEATATGAEVVRLSPQLFVKVSYRESPDGFLAVVPAIGSSLDDLSLGDNPLLLVCEAVEKPGNLGAMVRTGEAAGLTAVISADGVTDWGNPNTIRASKGTVFTVPVASAESAAAQKWLAERSVTIVATTPGAEVRFTEVDFTSPTAIVVGAESSGLSDGWIKHARVCASIPMLGRVNSLNVATSAAIVAYEALRQRLPRHD